MERDTAILDIKNILSVGKFLSKEKKYCPELSHFPENSNILINNLNITYNIEDFSTKRKFDFERKDKHIPIKNCVLPPFKPNPKLLKSMNHNTKHFSTPINVISNSESKILATKNMRNKPLRTEQNLINHTKSRSSIRKKRVLIIGLHILNIIGDQSQIFDLVY